MEEYRIFEEEKFNKILDLVEHANKDIIQIFNSIIKVIPQSIFKALSVADDFEVEGENYRSDLMRKYESSPEGYVYNESIDFDFQNDNGLRVQISVDSFEESMVDFGNLNANEENSDSSVVFGEDPKFVFSLTFSSKNKSLDCEVWIQPIQYSFEIVSAITLNGRQVSQNYITLSQAELIEYANDEMEISEDDFEEDEEDDIIVLSEEEYDKLKKELNAVTMVDDVAIDESTGEPEVEIEFFDGDEEDSLDDITDSYWFINKTNKNTQKRVFLIIVHFGF